MALASGDFDKVIGQDIHDLINGGVIESATIEYKREVYKGSDTDKKEFLKDISSIANSIGGQLGSGPIKGVPIETMI